MIVKMKKLILVMPELGVGMDDEITRLGQLGVMHIAPFQVAKDASIERVTARIQQLEKAIAILEKVDDEKATKSQKDSAVDYTAMDRGDVAMVEKVLELDEKQKQLQEKYNEDTQALKWYDLWGEVSAEDLKTLGDYGVEVKLYELSSKELKRAQELQDGVHVIGEADGKFQVAALSTEKEEALPFHEVEMPAIQPDLVKDAIWKTRSEIAETEAELIDLKSKIALLQDALAERQRRLDVRNVQYGGLSIDSEAQCFKGYLPIDKVADFAKTADEYQWGYVIEDPSEEEADEIPTQVKSPRWVDRIRPVMNFMGLVPGYKELDVSKVFMLFFTFFTGILVGDAGYGLIFFLLTLFAHSKQKFKKQIEFELFYVMSISVMFWGVLTGTYFGAETIANIPFLKQLIVSDLASFGGDTLFTQKFMFLIGAIHLSVGHLQLAWKYSNSVKAISELGWVAIVWGLYLIVNQMVLGIEAPDAMLWLFVGGTALVAFFSNPGGNFFKGMLSSIGNLPLSIINGFSDVISYIRLYAVGLSTVLMASSFNQMAIGEGVSTVFAMIGAVIILVLGHGLNMILAAMAVLVHGVRLNMLEYAGHANVEFSGSEYNPFKIKSNK